MINPFLGIITSDKYPLSEISHLDAKPCRLLRKSLYSCQYLMRNTMSEPQLSIRSTKARDLAHALARRTGQPINRLVEQALERYEQELREKAAQTPADTL
jgi:Rv0623-like transcription factor